MKLTVTALWRYGLPYALCVPLAAALGVTHAPLVVLVAALVPFTLWSFWWAFVRS